MRRLRWWVAAFALMCATRLRGVDAVQVVQRPLDAPAEAPRFANGKDVFGRDARCRTCHALLNTLNPRLVPALLKIKAKEARRASGGGADSRAVRYGLYEETIEAYVQSACTTQDLWHAKETRKQCERIMEEHEDDVASAYTRWIKKGAPEREDEGWSWNWEVCRKATNSCSEQLGMHALSEFDDDGSGAAERKYRSEPVPAPGTLDADGLLKVVAGSFYDVAVKDDTVDVLVYTSFPTQHMEGAFHRWIIQALVAVKALFAADPTGPTLSVAAVDAEFNDVPPPYGTGTTTPTLCVYPAGNKGWPRYISDVNDGQLTARDVLFFVMNTASAAVSEKAKRLMETAAADVLDSKPWERDEL